MVSVALRNVRSLGDTGPLTIKPLTILVGKNSSGKSTFTRFFPLLKQSVIVRSSAPILWFGDLVDFGSISHAKSNFTKEDIRFDINFDSQDIRNSRTFLNRGYRRRPLEIQSITFGLSLAEEKGRTKTTAVHLMIDDDRVNIEVESDGRIKKANINDIDFSNIFLKHDALFSGVELVPELFIEDQSKDERKVWYSARRRGFLSAVQEIKRRYRPNLHGSFSDQSLTRLVHRVRYAPPDRFIEIMQKAGDEYASWRQYTANLKAWSTEREHLRLLYLILALPDVFEALSWMISSMARGISYIGPFRATGERYYRSQELSVEEIDPSGTNIAMFLHSLNYSQQQQFREWSEQYLGYGIRPSSSSGHVSLMVREKGSNDEFNLADTGYGLSQVLPVMAQIWTLAFRRFPGRTASILAIEQPELHLHPAYQARIADALIGAISASREPQLAERSSDTLFLVETHSQQLINRVGELIYENRISPDDVAIYAFEKGGPDQATTIRTATFDKEGLLTNWPHGFFSSRGTA